MVSIETKNLMNIVEKIETARVLVIGDLMLDIFIRGNVVRISQEAPVPIVDFTSEIVRPGGAANAISNIRALGGEAAAVGVIGDDPEGKCLLDLLSQNGVDISGILVSTNRRTTQKTRIISEKNQQDLLRIDKNNTSEITIDMTGLLIERIKELIDSIDIILISDYNEGVITSELLDVLIPLAKSKKKTIVVDSKGEHLLDYCNVDLVKVDHQVASTITGVGEINATSIRNIGQWMLTHLGSEYVLITRGKDGMTLFNKKGDVIHIPSIAKEIKEVTGVADTVGAVIALSLSVDRNRILEAAVLANTTAGIKVGKIGTATVTRQELLQVLEGLDLSQLIQKNNC
jgi:D-beta-D-heptose 7-phosphate kinase/D-beta-D-heptose 1-phosphate adenosyltransferase